MANEKKGFFDSLSGAIGGAASFLTHPLERGIEKTRNVKLQNEKIRAFIESQKIQDHLRQIQADAIASGRTMTGATPRGAGAGAGTSEADEILKQLNALGTVRGKFEDEEGVIDPSVAPFLEGLSVEVGVRGAKFIDRRKAQRRRTQEAELKGGMTDRIAVDKKAKIDNRPMFGGPDIAFSRLPSTQDVDAITGASPQAPAADFIQAATAAFPRSTVPLTYQQIGLTAKDDIEQFAELEKKLPDMDLRTVYQSYPEGFAAILKALKAGKDPQGKPFGIKEAIALIQKIQ